MLSSLFKRSELTESLLQDDKNRQENEIRNAIEEIESDIRINTLLVEDNRKTRWLKIERIAKIETMQSIDSSYWQDNSVKLTLESKTLQKSVIKINQDLAVLDAKGHVLANKLQEKLSALAALPDNGSNKKDERFKLYAAKYVPPSVSPKHSEETEVVSYYKMLNPHC